MKSIANVSVIGVAFLGFSLSCLAEIKPQAAQVHEQRKVEAAEAAREFKPGEGDPVPESRPKVPRSDRVKAREVRKTAGGEAARAFAPVNVQSILALKVIPTVRGYGPASSVGPFAAVGPRSSDRLSP